MDVVMKKMKDGTITSSGRISKKGIKGAELPSSASEDFEECLKYTSGTISTVLSKKESLAKRLEMLEKVREQAASKKSSSKLKVFHVPSKKKNRSPPKREDVCELDLEDLPSLPPLANGTSPNNIVLELLHKLLENQSEIHQQLDKISEQLKAIEKEGQLEAKVEMLEKVKEYPFHTMDQFKEGETDEFKEKRNRMFQLLKNLGARSSKAFANVALKEVMDDNLVQKFTYYGSDSMMPLHGTKLLATMFFAAKECMMFEGPLTMDEFRVDIQEAIRTSKQRSLNKTKTGYKRKAAECIPSFKKHIRKMNFVTLESSESEKESSDREEFDEEEK